LSLNGLWASERKPQFGVASNQKSVAASQATSERLLREAFQAAGIRINGANPWDIQVNDTRFYDRVISNGSLGLGETYVEGWWDCQQIDEAIRKIMEARLEHHFVHKWQLAIAALKILRARIFNLQSEQRAAEIAKVHYDLGAEFFRAVLGATMMYSCAYWKDAASLDQAQEDKLDLICRKLQIQGSDRVLDVGCGWGGFLKHVAGRFGCASTGITISAKQCEYAKDFCTGLPVRVLLSDYRAPDLEQQGRFDKVTSIGMFEHVGRKNYRTFIKIIDSLMTEDGLFLLQTIGRCRPEGASDPWMNKYIFPNGTLPSAAEIAEAIEGHFVIEDWHSFGADYDRTLMAWHANFEASTGSCEEAFSKSFRQMWRYYLLSCAGSFRARQGPQLWQIVLSKSGVAGGYRSVR
jgi:cyclopropane-fatty-acyl-phospholipid synthase